MARRSPPGPLRKLSWLTLPIVLLAACAAPPPAQQEAVPVASAVSAVPPEQEALRKIAERQTRLDRVTAPLLLNNTELCKAHARKLLGFSAKNKLSYSAELAEAAAKEFGFDERLQVTNVLAGSGAEQAGVRRGDILIAADGKPVPAGENAERQAAALLAPLVNAKPRVKLTLERRGSLVRLDIPPTPACGFSVELGNADLVNAFADGRRIVVTRGMMDVAQSDTELAYVIAREMAHNILGHANQQRIVATMAGIIDNLARVNPDLSTMTGTSGVRPFSAELDAAADRLALYLAARAGYSIEPAAAFWRRLASQVPTSVLNGYTAIHPSTSQRLAAITQAQADIRARQAANRPLIP